MNITTDIRAAFTAAPKPIERSSKDREFDFISCALPALIQSCGGQCTPEGIVKTTRMLRQVYREAFK